ncbi:MAG TPA: caspase family protein, partial [Geminicoccaceae bacterium]|nr:caspase family protein [Geminicoccaceae bacterium]
MRGLVLMFFVLLVLATAAAPASADRRVALVVGNGAYVHAPALPNPRNDAEAMAATLRQLGFEVELGVDLDKARMSD